MTDTFGSTIDRFAPEIYEISFSESACSQVMALFFSWGKLETESWAVFLNGSYDFSDACQLGFDFRYTDETKDTLWHLDGARSGAFNIGSTSPGGYVDSRADTHFSPMLSLSYLMNDDTHIYARYSTGYKSGGFNLDYITQGDLDDKATTVRTARLPHCRALQQFSQD